MAVVLAFERPVVELVARVRELRELANEDPRFGAELRRLEEKAAVLAREVFAGLTPMQKVQVARHPSRPYSQDYIERLFERLRGAARRPSLRRRSGDRRAGLGRFHGRSVAIVGHRKGRSTKENMACNFGMPNPEGYRKAIRLYEMADRFGLPIFTFVDTPGAYCGIGAEERGQSEAIGHSIEVMSRMTVPIISTVIGEGGSGGALALGVANRVLVLEFSYYSVITPEGCAAILWKSGDLAPEAAARLKITAPNLLSWASSIPSSKSRRAALIRITTRPRNVWMPCFTPSSSP